jgi:hypothetical protein
VNLPRAVALTAVTALALVGCSGGKKDEGTATTRTTVAAADRTTTTGAAAAGSKAAALETLLVTAVPSGYRAQPDDVGDTGPSDLAKAASDDGDPDATAVLTSAGFVAGYQRLWVNQNDDELIVFLYQFAQPAGATSYNERSIAGSGPATAFAVAGVPGAKGFSVSDAQNTSAVVFFTKGAYLVQVVSNTSAGKAQSELVTTIATDQYQRLPGVVA